MANVIGIIQDAAGNSFQAMDDGTKVPLTPGVSSFQYAGGVSVPVTPVAAPTPKTTPAPTPAATSTPAQTTPAEPTKPTAAPTTTKISDIPAVQSTYDAMIAQGFSPAAALSSARYAGQAVQAGALPAATTYTATGQTIAPVVTPPTGGGNNKGNTPPATNDLQAAKDRILADTLRTYGLEGIDKVIAQIRADYPEISQSDLITLLKDDPKYNSLYNQRFAGNVKRKAMGIQPLSDSDYLKAEIEYASIFKAYGVDSLANRDTYATLIANRYDAQDISERIGMAYDVYKGNPNVKNAFNQFFGTVTDGDVIAAMLAPDTQIPLLQEKIRVAEIGGAALQQNLKTSLVSAQELEKYGVTGATAQAGYAAIAPKLERGQFLNQLSPELGVTYDQTTAENIQFKKSAADIKKEQQIVSAEYSRWGGSAGRLASKDRAQGLI